MMLDNVQGATYTVTDDDNDVLVDKKPIKSVSVRFTAAQKGELKKKIDSKLKLVYEGEWRDDLQHGIGRYHYPNGDVYTGSLVKGKRAGYGKLIFGNKDNYIGSSMNDKYIGSFLNDFMHGTGCLVKKYRKAFAEDYRLVIYSTYTGQFHENKYHGTNLFTTLYISLFSHIYDTL
jgi:hypothetical protein